MYTTNRSYAPNYRRAPPRRGFSRATMGDFSIPIPGVTTPYQPTAPFVFYKTPASPVTSSKKTPPSGNLDEVVVNAKYQTATPYADAAMPEVVVSATRIPWYVWAALGGVEIALVLGLSRK